MDGRQPDRRRRWIAGLAVDVRRAGPPTGAPFVLVHGIGVSSRYFRRLAAVLARTDPVVTVDLPGFGSTPKPPRVLSVPELAEVLAECLADIR
ncbi:alpha/beta fold hydrolase [Nakamurella endophytica]|uniref:AB hydrolase-1 domain-containing protein n=1 Tax=Nakamurella endophytica TaxID=1748367 RepID=A0A917WDG8_9ACTN|nr:alpha/beta fold hydrolase [Nakamurella endophytica]GGL95143.1 hypothetical protein GCM10011594_13570 [Nakamurella endophytica]